LIGISSKGILFPRRTGVCIDNQPATHFPVIETKQSGRGSGSAEEVPGPAPAWVTPIQMNVALSKLFFMFTLVPWAFTALASSFAFEVIGRGFLDRG
jgi:hypothetical protein